MTKVENLVNRCMALTHGLSAEVLYRDLNNTLWLKCKHKDLEIFCETYVSQELFEIRVREAGGKSFLFDVYGQFKSAGGYIGRGIGVKVVTYRQGNWEDRLSDLLKR